MSKRVGVIAFGLVSEAVCVLVGPIFIPFFVVPNLEWLFWGWFKAFIQYAFYPVVANAFILVFGEMLINFLDTHPSPGNAQTICRRTSASSALSEGNGNR